MPKSLIDREDLTIYERVILPYVIRHTMAWGYRRPGGINAGEIAAFMRIDILPVQDALERLEKKKIVEKGEITKQGERSVVWSVHKDLVAEANVPRLIAPVADSGVSYDDPNAFLNMANERFEDLHMYALEFLEEHNLPSSIFDDYVDRSRTNNTVSFDFEADFRLFAKRIGGNKLLHVTTQGMKSTLDEYRPDAETFRVAQYFFQRHKEINPKFEEPFNMMAEAKQIKVLLDSTNFSLDDVALGINWLFSRDGNWYRPNIMNCKALRLKFRYIQQHLVSWKDKPDAMPPGTTVFDLIEKGGH